MHKKTENIVNDEKGLKTLLTFTGIIIILTGTVTLLGWITGISALINLVPSYLPMAPVNSLFFVIFGIILVIGFFDKTRKSIRLVLILTTVLISAYGLLQFAGYLVKADLNFEYTLFPVKETLGNFPLRHMSPYAGLLFFISGTGVLLKFTGREKFIILNLIGGLGIIIAFAGFVAGSGYLFGTPFLYSGNIIPLSIRTAISFLFLGLGLVLTAGGKTVFMRNLVGPTANARLLRVLIPLIISLFLLQGVLDVILTHIYKINEALLLAFSTIFSVLISIPVITNITKKVFKSANIAENERLKALDELKKINSLQNLILENNVIGIYMVREYTFQWANSRLNEIFRISQDERLQGISTSKIFSTEESYNKQIEWESIIKKGKTIDSLLELRRNDGEMFWCRFIGTPLEHDKPGEGSIWMVEDITERKLLREKMRLLSHTIESLSECISITDTSDRIIFVNKAFETTYGYRQDELSGENISVISSEENDPHFIKSILPATLSGGWEGEIINRKKDGSTFPVHIATSKVVNEKGEVVALVGVATDITERRKTDMQLKKYAEDLKVSNDAKDKLFSIISHDLRSPFNSILGFINLLSEQYDDISEEERKSFIRDLKKSSENTFTLLENLLTWARTQTGGIKVNAIPFNLSEVVEKQLEVLRNGAASKKITLINQVSPDVNVFADRDMVKTIIINLVSNAIKFTMPEGTIIIKAIVYSSEIQVSVEDNGVGITRSVLDNMFKLDKSNSTLGTSNEKGTGLGLLICKEFTEKNGGKISVESEPGKGSKFLFTLPLYTPVFSVGTP